MSEYSVAVTWQRDQAVFTDNRYSRAHLWKFDGGAEVRASSSPHVVPVPLSDPSGVDPEEAFVAALSSCHMLWFLSIAAKRSYVVDRYVDNAVGTMEKNSEGRLVMTHVRLRPSISFSAERLPDEADVEAMHHEAHASCYIANSVKTVVMVEPPESIVYG